jgi:histidinol-phosphate/aromatic aminotransferase/cobyric acid decarboxylase-like protein
MVIASPLKVTLSIASVADRQKIYIIRHSVYANELGQHASNPSGELRDDLDLCNHYIVAKQGDKVIGFISITPPSCKRYSIDKYFCRSDIPLQFDDELFEIRLLTVVEQKRNTWLAFALMYSSFRWVQSHGGKHLVSICRSDLLGMYTTAGLQPLNKKVISGRVSYDLCIANTADLQNQVQCKLAHYEALRRKADWQLPYCFFAPAACYHGGTFFKAIGEDLQNLENTKHIINADVLDAWFPPSPRVMKVLQEHLPWLLQTSPPTHAEGLTKVIAQVRGVKLSSILAGAGSSDLIFLAFRALLTNRSRVLIIDPCYGEYIHVLENIIECQVNRFTLRREDDFVVDRDALGVEMGNGYDMVVLVNPNSPTGKYIPKEQMVELLKNIPSSTLVWIDETYIEYTRTGESLEAYAAGSENTIVCKSMSKVYALSGVRAAYLCSPPHLLETLKALAPPWALSLPAQAAAIAALQDEAYYRTKYLETERLRTALKRGLQRIRITEVIEGSANFLLFYLTQPLSAQLFLELCREEGLFLRNAGNMGRSLGTNALRIAVKDADTNERMIAIMERSMARMKNLHLVNEERPVELPASSLNLNLL